MHSTLGTLPNISEKDAARLLVTPTALGELSFKDALRVVSYLKPKRIKAGAVFIREGDESRADFMMLLMAGEVRVEMQMPAPQEPITMAVLGPGHLLGEIAMVRGSPRSATCTASTELAVAVLTRSALAQLMQDDAQLAVRFLLAVSSRMAGRLHETTDKLKRFMQLNTVLQKEVFTLMDSLDKRQTAKAKKTALYEPTQPMELLANFVPGQMPDIQPRRQK